jgi:hypothetical protein
MLAMLKHGTEFEAAIGDIDKVPGTLCSWPSPGPGDGLMTSDSAALPPSPRLLSGEAQGERHTRLLAPLAFLSPRIIAAIVNGTVPADLTVTCLAKALPYAWIEQERSIGL